MKKTFNYLKDEMDSFELFMMGIGMTLVLVEVGAYYYNLIKGL